jgi:hypothetical protein
VGSPAESLEKKNIFLKNSDEIRKLDGIGNPLANICYFQKLPIPPEEFVRGLPMDSDTL